MRAENAILYDDAFLANFLGDSFVQISRSVGKFGVTEIGAIACAFSERTGKRKLRYEQYLAACLFYVEIHFVVLVAKDSKF